MFSAVYRGLKLSVSVEPLILAQNIFFTTAVKFVWTSLSLIIPSFQWIQPNFGLYTSVELKSSKGSVFLKEFQVIKINFIYPVTFRRLRIENYFIMYIKYMQLYIYIYKGSEIFEAVHILFWLNFFTQTLSCLRDDVHNFLCNKIN